MIGPLRSQDARNYEPLIIEVANGAGRHALRLFNKDSPLLELADLYNHTGLGHDDSIVFRQNPIPNPVFQRHKRTPFLGLQNRWSVLKGITGCTLMDWPRREMM